MKNRKLIKEVLQFKKIAGLLKEHEFAGFKPEYKGNYEVDEENADYFIEGIFDEASIYNNQKIAMFISRGGRDEDGRIVDYNTALATAEDAIGYDEDGIDIEDLKINAKEMFTITFPEQGKGELMGDYRPELTKGKVCKLDMSFGADLAIEFWQ